MFNDDAIEITPESNNKGTVAIVSYDNPDTVKKVYGFFKRNGFTHPAAAGITANLYCESGLNPQNVGDDVNSDAITLYVGDDSSGNPIYKKNRSPWAGKGGITDKEFTEKVDSGEITKDEFTSAEWGTLNNNGSYGYGLMQWCTPPENKRELYEYAKNDQHTSIGDMDMQLKYILKCAEKNDPGFTNRINAESTPEDAADYFESHLERCGNASSQAKRRTTARTFYDELKDYDDFNTLVPKGAFYSDYLQNSGTPTSSGPFGDFTGTRDYIWENTVTEMNNSEGITSDKLTIPKATEEKKKYSTSTDIKYDKKTKGYTNPVDSRIKGGGFGEGRSSSATVKQIHPYKKSVAHTTYTSPKRGGHGEVSIYSPSITATFKPSITAKKYISSSSSTDVTTAINYIIGYLEAITNNTAGANDKLTALRNLSNSNQIYVGTTNNNINGKPTKSTTVVKSSNNGQINDSISRGMQIAQKIAKG